MERKLDIRVVSGVSAGDVFHFKLNPEGGSLGSEVLIGRDPACTLVLQDPSVSRRHAAIKLRGDHFWISDEGSTHGTVHMGFRLESGDGGARKLENGDEFKIGEAIFSVRFADPSSEVSDVAKTASIRASGVQRMLQGRFKWYVAIGLLLLLVLVALPPEEAPQLPPQKSAEVLRFPEQRVIGYWPGPGGDTIHLDKAQFELPAADQVVEYEIVNESPVKLYVGEELVETIPSHLGSWQKRIVVIRDVVGGLERRLVFDNTDFPRSEQTKGGGLKKWKVWNVRTSPISRFIDSSFDDQLAETASMLARIDTSPDALFLAIRAVQRCIIEALAEARLEAADFEVPLERTEDTGVKLDAEMLSGAVRAISEERQPGFGGSGADHAQHLRKLAKVAADLDAELWRRVNSRMMRARLASEAANYGVAYASLKSALSMFPEEGDYRFELVNKLFLNEKVVPKKVRDKPAKYLKTVQGEY
jgi:hypothetical protein